MAAALLLAVKAPLLGALVVGALHALYNRLRRWNAVLPFGRTSAIADLRAWALGVPRLSGCYVFNERRLQRIGLFFFL